jgi:YggT family protein
MYIILKLINIYIYIIIIHAVVSWLNPDPSIAIIQFLNRITDPFLNRIRNILPVTGSIDFSPAAGIIILLLLKQVLVYIFL